MDRASSRELSAVMALADGGYTPLPGSRVVHTIDRHDEAAYRDAARFCSDYPCTCVSLQHEYGLYPGERGESILQFAANCEKPIVATLHTLLPEPDAKAREAIRELARLSEAAVVMTPLGVRLLERAYGVTASAVFGRGGNPGKAARAAEEMHMPRHGGVHVRKGIASAEKVFRTVC